MSYKNQLQEYFQKSKRPLPTYISQEVVDCLQNGRPKWKSYVQLYDGRKFSGVIEPTRRGAEQSAAQAALDDIKSTNRISYSQAVSQTRTTQLLDFNNRTMTTSPSTGPLAIRNPDLELAIKFALPDRTAWVARQRRKLAALKRQSSTASPMQVQSPSAIPSRNSNDDHNTETVHLQLNAGSPDPPDQMQAKDERLLVQLFPPPCSTSPPSELGYSSSAISREKDEPHSTQRTCILVDVENMPSFVESLLKEENKVLETWGLVNVLAFVGEHHCLAERSWKNITPETTLGIQKIYVPSTRKNAVDTCMQIYIGHLLATSDYDNYIIVTRDSFGSVLVEMINANGMPWPKRYARLASRMCHVI